MDYPSYPFFFIWKESIIQAVLSKGESIGFSGYVGNLILRIYREISVDVLTQNTCMTKIDKEIHRNIGKN